MDKQKPIPVRVIEKRIKKLMLRSVKATYEIQTLVKNPNIDEENQIYLAGKLEKYLKKLNLKYRTEI